MSSLDDLELCQLGGERPALILVWADWSTDSLAVEGRFRRWRGVREILSMFCKVCLNLETNREAVSGLPVRSVPALVLLDTRTDAPLAKRVVSVLDELDERERVLAFLEAGFETDLRGGETVEFATGEVKSVTSLIEEAELARRLSDAKRAESLLEQAYKAGASGETKLRRGIARKRGDLAYETSRFEDAIRRYREAWDLSVKGATDEETVHVLVRLALLLNDRSENEEASRLLEEALRKVQEAADRERLDRYRAAVRGGLFVLAGEGYPGVRGGGGIAKEPEDLGDPSLSYEERLRKANEDLDHLAAMLAEAFQAKGGYPDQIFRLFEDPKAVEAFRDPFLFGSEYHYLHFEEPEDFLLYSIGPDGMDQMGEVDFNPSEGEKGQGDLTRRPVKE
ncbi:MAG: hypothetical protein GHCLOJNM_01914 [bacterium]|nr:hypothetical protein [bacterium]